MRVKWVGYVLSTAMLAVLLAPQPASAATVLAGSTKVRGSGASCQQECSVFRSVCQNASAQSTFVVNDGLSYSVVDVSGLGGRGASVSWEQTTALYPSQLTVGFLGLDSNGVGCRTLSGTTVFSRPGFLVINPETKYMFVTASSPARWEMILP